MQYLQRLNVFLICFLLLGPLSQLSAQLSYTFRHYTVRDGLPSTYIYDIVQDNKGFLWIATESGLCKFDGKTFEKDPVKSIGSAEVINLVMNEQNQLWLFDLANNVHVYDGDTLISLSNNPAFENKSFDDVYIDPSGDFWLSGTGEDEIFFIKDSYLNDSTIIRYKSQIIDKTKTLVGPKTFIHISDSLQLLISQRNIVQFRKHRMDSIITTEIPFGGFPFNNVRIKDTLFFQIT